MYIFDIEGDSLDATKIHCLSYTMYGPTKNKIVTLTSYDDMRKFLLSADVLIGHNITLWDVPTLNRLLGIKIKARLIDTLAISWYIQPDRLRHGLESYGLEYGLLKKEIEDWENLSLGRYIERCERDVEINRILWTNQHLFLKRLYGTEDKLTRLVRYLAFKMDCAAAQEAAGWKLDVERCKAGIQELSIERDNKIQELRAQMPQVPVIKTKTKPAKMYKQDGTLSKAGLDWNNLICIHPEENGTVTYIADYEEPNPQSVQQIKDYLFSLGWQPDEFKHVRNKETGEMRKIPQINTQIPGETGVSASVKRLFDIEPRLEALDGLTVINHRLSLLQGFLDSADENGFVKASIQGFTNTLRFIHKTVVNLPKVGKPYGELIRGCLIASDGQELCGADKSSLEDRIKQHFLMPHDPDYVAKMSAPDYDPHLTLAEFAGFISNEEHEGYKKDKASFKHIKKIRDYSKNTNYACQYGATGFRVAITCGISEEEGNNLVENYWKLNWAIKAVSDEQVYKVLGTPQNAGQMWLYNPVSKLWYSLRSKKDIFSTLCQGTAAYTFDVWISYVRRKHKPMTGQFHDEGIWTIPLGMREEFEALLRWAIEEANKELKLNRRLDIDVQFGQNYAAIH